MVAGFFLGSIIILNIIKETNITSVNKHNFSVEHMFKNKLYDNVISGLPMIHNEGCIYCKVEGCIYCKVESWK